MPIPVLAPNGLLRLNPEVWPKLKVLVPPNGGGLAPNPPVLVPPIPAVLPKENPLVVPKLVGWDVLPKRVGPVVGLANKLLAGAPKPLAAVVVVPNAGFELNRLEPAVLVLPKPPNPPNPALVPPKPAAWVVGVEPKRGLFELVGQTNLELMLWCQSQRSPMFRWQLKLQTKVCFVQINLYFVVVAVVAVAVVQTKMYQLRLELD